MACLELRGLEEGPSSPKGHQQPADLPVHKEQCCGSVHPGSDRFSFRIQDLKIEGCVNFLTAKRGVLIIKKGKLYC
jgi:hypothetical protein